MLRACRSFRTGTRAPSPHGCRLRRGSTTVSEAFIRKVDMRAGPPVSRCTIGSGSARWRSRAGRIGGSATTPLLAIPEAAQGRASILNHPLASAGYDAVNEVYFDDLEAVRARLDFFGEHDPDAPTPISSAERTSSSSRASHRSHSKLSGRLSSILGRVYAALADPSTPPILSMCALRESR